MSPSTGSRGTDVQPLLDNARRYGRSTVNVTVARTSTIASIGVDDDGARRRLRRARRHLRARHPWAAASAHEGAGLGAAPAQRLARSAGATAERLRRPGQAEASAGPETRRGTSMTTTAPS